MHVINSKWSSSKQPRSSWLKADSPGRLGIECKRMRCRPWLCCGNFGVSDELRCENLTDHNNRALTRHHSGLSHIAHPQNSACTDGAMGTTNPSWIINDVAACARVEGLRAEGRWRCAMGRGGRARHRTIKVKGVVARVFGGSGIRVSRYIQH